MPALRVEDVQHCGRSRGLELEHAKVRFRTLSSQTRRPLIHSLREYVVMKHKCLKAFSACKILELSLNCPYIPRAGKASTDFAPGDKVHVWSSSASRRSVYRVLHGSGQSHPVPCC